MMSVCKTNSFLFALIFLTILMIASSPLYADHVVNINTADKATLTTLTGIGEVKAQAIIDYRTTNGLFANIEDIQNVSGIGPATFENIRNHIVVNDDGLLQGQPKNNAQEPAAPLSQAGSGLYPVEPHVVVYAGDDRVAIVGADVVLKGKAFTKDGEPLGPVGVRFLWNFGDGKTAEGAQVTHRWMHPGRYVVTLDVSAGNNSASHRIIVTAKPALLSLATFDDGSVVIENKSDSELDLSLWHIRSGGHLFSIPEDTVVLVKEKIIIPPQSLGFSAGSDAVLLYPNGEVAGTILPLKPFIAHVAVDQSKTDVPAQKHVASKTTSVNASAHASTQQTAAAAAVTADDTTNLNKLFDTWTLALFGLTLCGAIGAYLVSRGNKKEWDIVEERV